MKDEQPLKSPVSSFQILTIGFERADAVLWAAPYPETVLAPAVPADQLAAAGRRSESRPG